LAPTTTCGNAGFRSAITARIRAGMLGLRRSALWQMVPFIPLTSKGSSTQTSLGDGKS
jgi:hypothetical protein